MDKRWRLKKQPQQKIVQELSRAINVNETLAELLVQRGLHSYEAARAFFRPHFDQLHDPFLMRDMDKAVNRLSLAVAKQQKVLIYGDYDVDGTTSVALAFAFLSGYLDHIEYYIPDRYTEGYGISMQGVEWALEQEFGLMIALDCGITGHDPILRAQEGGLDVIVCDHHQPGPELPAALAILDPKRADCTYPFKELSGCGVGYKLLQAFCLQQSIPMHALNGYLDLVAVSIASDIVPILDENRVLAYFGLEKLNEDPLPGLMALKEISGLRRKVNISDVVFYIGPRINAAGRLAHARESVALLLANDAENLNDFSHNLNDHNADRKDHDRMITEAALKMIEAQFPNAKSTVLWHKNWHKGVVGIVASRCIEHYYRPTIILTGDGDEITGSARSVAGFDIYQAIGECSDLLIQFGGHKYAAGLKLKTDQLENFRQAFELVVGRNLTEDQMLPTLDIDLNVPFSFINFKVLHIIEQMAPFGPGNLAPLFQTDHVEIRRPIKAIKDTHAKMLVYQQGYDRGFEAMAFGMVEKLGSLMPDTPFSMVYQIEENEYRGHRSIQLIVKDIKFAV